MELISSVNNSFTPIFFTSSIFYSINIFIKKIKGKTFIIQKIFFITKATVTAFLFLLQSFSFNHFIIEELEIVSLKQLAKETKSLLTVELIYIFVC